MKNLLLSFTALAFASSCALIMNAHDPNNAFDYQTINYADQQCIMDQDSPYTSSLSGSPFTSAIFNDFLTKVKSKHQFTFAEEIVIWSLIQMIARPDLASPSSQLIAYLHIKDSTYFYRFKASQDLNIKQRKNSFPYLYGLDIILSKHPGRYNLGQLAKILDQNLERTIRIGEGFKSFLQSNSSIIKNEPIFKETYLKGNQLIQNEESYGFTSFQKLNRLYQKQKPHQSIDQESTFNFIDKEAGIKCDFDLQAYRKSQFMISDYSYPSHHFALKKSQQAAVLISGQDLGHAKPFLNDTTFIAGDSTIRLANTCQYEKNNDQLYIIAADSRDPGQHILHYLNFFKEKKLSKDNIKAILPFSRFEFLNSPVKLIYESDRAVAKQFEQLQTLGIPIYHKTNLAKVWLLSQTSNNLSLYPDPRYESFRSCPLNTIE